LIRTHPSASSRLFRKHIALPQQHGSWALWLGPLAVGAGVAGRASSALPWLILAAFGGFLLLQPLTILIKALAGRRAREDLAPALVWSAFYGAMAALGALGLAIAGHGRVVLLALAAVPVLAWQMWLVARRSERGRVGVELVGAGALALVAPAAFWVNAGGTGATGWWLWLLCWLQSAGAIVYIYLRLAHRKLAAVPAWHERLRLARRSTLYNAGNLVIVAALAAWGAVPWLAVFPFAAMLAEAVYGGLVRPAVGARPVTLGVRQMAITLVNSVLLVAAYRL
jgi:hypothetical protein